MKAATLMLFVYLCIVASLARAQSGNNLEIIHWFRVWDENSEKELGIPEGSGRQLAQQMGRG